ncbi:MAG: prolyl-tRNA synthetase associated domain-containing protein [Clostridia bacterium]|nr:prolyl-tRNA synthetase associated domain-containing protein [Clostridia bacterium]
MSHKEAVYERLDGLGIPYERHEHALVHTMADCLALPYAAPDVTFCKNILLCNRQQTAYWLFVTEPLKPFRTAVVSKLLGTSRLSFAPSEQLMPLLGLESGSLSPLALWFDTGKRMTLALDRDIRREGRIAFHPCDATSTVIFSQQVFWNQVLPALTASPVLLTLPGADEQV